MRVTDVAAMGEERVLGVLARMGVTDVAAVAAVGEERVSGVSAQVGVTDAFHSHPLLLTYSCCALLPSQALHLVSDVVPERQTNSNSARQKQRAITLSICSFALP